MEEKIELGDLVEDTLTGLQGITIVELIHITGCHQFRVQPRIKLSNGYLGDSYVFDISRLKLIEKDVWKHK